MKCDYLNPDNTCNSTLLCEDKECEVINSNYKNVEEKALNLIDNGLKSLKELRKERGRK